MGSEILAWIIGAIPGGANLIVILTLIGTLRTVNKLLFTFLHEAVKATSTQYDDNLLEQLEKSKIYTALAYVLDLVASIKLPAKK